jgi:hypothetical protein
MRDQIFLSHAHEDKEIVGLIAEELRQTFGQNNIFYDSWSMKPGENFIDGMNKGLERCLYFFLFMSETSLKKQMVRLEWHNALLDSLNDKSHFIPIRMDNIQPPVILMTTLYLDMYNRGLPQTIEDMKSIVWGRGLYNPNQLKPFQNLYIEVTKNPNKVTINIGARRLVEHENYFAFWTSDGKNPVVPGLADTSSGHITMNGRQKEVHIIRQHRSITPHSPAIFEINEPSEIINLEVYHIVGNQVNLIYTGTIR